MGTIPWLTGFEVELLLPPGKSRADLASVLATPPNWRARRLFHLQSEPSAVVGMEVFHNLTLGYVVEDAQGRWQFRCVDDLTLQADLRREAEPRPGWYRIVSDDPRILRLIEQQADAADSLEEVLLPIARLFGTELVGGSQGMWKVCDSAGGSVAMVCSLPGERERPCEIVTAPWETDQGARLQGALDKAAELGCLVPVEGATHVHFDARGLRSAPVLRNLVNFLHAYGPLLKWLFDTNSRCTRLGDWPAGLPEMVNTGDFLEQPWDGARARLRGARLSKYCDFNLLNLTRDDDFCTVELRVLPSGLQAEPVIAAAHLFAHILRRAQVDKPFPALQAQQPRPRELEYMLSELRLEAEVAQYWRERAAVRPQAVGL